MEPLCHNSTHGIKIYRVTRYKHPRHCPRPASVLVLSARSGMPSEAFRAVTVQSQAPNTRTPLLDTAGLPCRPLRRKLAVLYSHSNAPVDADRAHIPPDADSLIGTPMYTTRPSGESTGAEPIPVVGAARIHTSAPSAPPSATTLEFCDVGSVPKNTVPCSLPSGRGVRPTVGEERSRTPCCLACQATLPLEACSAYISQFRDPKNTRPSRTAAVSAVSTIRPREFVSLQNNISQQQTR